MSQPDIRKNKYLSNPDSKETDKNSNTSKSLGNVPLNVKPVKQTFTQVRIWDHHIEKLKLFCFENNLTSYSELINNIVGVFIEENNL
jgi:hypothetical protein